MTDYTIRTIDAAELTIFYKRIKQDFPVGEYPPYEILYRHLQEGLQEGLVFRSGEHELAYSFCAASSDYVLISLLAVFPEFRGQGVGSAFLPALITNYAGRPAIIGEVECPELAANAAGYELRKRRIEFYKQAGFYLLPGIDYSIWDVPMHLMAVPMSASRQTIDDNIKNIMYQIYIKLMGKQFMHKMILHKGTG